MVCVAVLSEICVLLAGLCRSNGEGSSLGAGEGSTVGGSVVVLVALRGLSVR